MRGMSPSTAGRWTACPGSVKLSQPYLGQPKTEAAKEGIAAHWVFEQRMAGHLVSVGDTGPNDIIVTQEMIDCALELEDLLPEDVLIEGRVNIDRISAGMTGRVDAYCYEGTTLRIFDYKFGHTPVAAFENKQLLVTAAALITSATETIELNIFQPRVYDGNEGFDRWSLTTEEYLNEYLPDLIKAAQDAQSDNPEVNTGSHCSMCPARHACRAFQEATLSIVDMTKDASTLELPDDALGRELSTMLDAMDRLKARISGLEQQAELALEKGRPIRGFELQPQQGRLDWDKPANKVLELAQVLGVDIRRPTAPVTPTQAIKAGMDEKVVKSVASRANKGAKVKRVNLNQMRKVFKNE